MLLAEHLRQVFALEPESWALEFGHDIYSWGELAALAEAVGTAIGSTGAQDYDPVGWAAQNSPSAVASLCGMLLTQHCAAVLNPNLAPKILAEDIVQQKFPVLVGDPRFWALPGVAAAAKKVGSAGLVVTWEGANSSVRAYPGLEQVGPGPHRPPMPDGVIERISSGTTGPPKRSPQTMAGVLNSLKVGQHRERGVPGEPLRIKASPAIIFKSLAHAGIGSVMLALYAARPILLQEKFDVEATMAAVAKHRPKVLQLVPTMIKMIMLGEVPASALSSLIAVRSGTAPLDPQLQKAFEAKYGIPILIDYGATEFGGVTAWTLADHRKFACKKPGSVGRVVQGAQIRIRDPQTGRLIEDGKTGLLEVYVERRTDDWVSTNDLAEIDFDGFLYIRGRADDAIIRGGFKVLPNEIENVLRQHPDVQDAAVIGVPDARLGQVPVAVIEIQNGRQAPDEDELRALAKEHLAPYQMPVSFKFIENLPRTTSMKVIRSELLEIAKGTKYLPSGD